MRSLASFEVGVNTGLSEWELLTKQRKKAVLRGHAGLCNGLPNHQVEQELPELEAVDLGELRPDVGTQHQPFS